MIRFGDATLPNAAFVAVLDTIVLLSFSISSDRTMMRAMFMEIERWRKFGISKRTDTSLLSAGER